MERFVLVSCLLHVVGIFLFGVTLTQNITKKTPPVVKVNFVEEKRQEKMPVVIDAPMPEVPEKASTKEFVSNADSRMHSNVMKHKSEEYVGHKTVLPKAGVPEPQPVSKLQPPAPPQPETPREPPQPKQAPPTPPPTEVVEKGILSPEAPHHVEAKMEVKPKPAAAAQPETRIGSPSAALYDGFDPAKYAALDTHNPNAEEGDDDRPISLDTTESKYASYFARIKQQIERVWVYPLEAARRGVAGELTLRFQISRDGTLLSLGVVRESGVEILDFAAIKAVKNAAPFYPIPSTIHRDKIAILATFIYNPTYSAH